MVSVKAVDMHSPCAMRSAVKLARSGALARSAVGTASSSRLIQTPRTLSIRRANSATAMPATAMPNVLALTAIPIAPGVTRKWRTRAGSSACAANRSTRVRKLIRPIATIRRSTRRGKLSLVMATAPGRMRGGGADRSGAASAAETHIMWASAGSIGWNRSEEVSFTVCWP
jgi:hypothetical protein